MQEQLILLPLSELNHLKLHFLIIQIQWINLLENQTEITDLYSELSYDELKDVLEGWLNPTAESSSDEPTSESTTLSESKPKQEVNDLPFDVDESKPTPSKKTDDVASDV